MSASKLSLYNDALMLCGERALANLTENREPRRLLDQAWATDAVTNCLELGQWNFAARSQKIVYSPSVAPDFGYRRAFNKPTDYVRTMAVCQDEYFKVPLLEYVDEAGYWFSDLDTIYVRFVSNDVSYGADYSLWPQSFEATVYTYLASRVVYKITQDKDRWQLVERALAKVTKEAKSIDAMNEPTTFPARGSWVRSRLTSVNNDRGYRTGNLTG